MIKKNNNPAYHSYHGMVRDSKVHTEADVSVSNHVPMNSVSAGHPVIGKPIRNVKEAREQMKKAAGIISKKDKKRITKSNKLETEIEFLEERANKIREKLWYCFYKDGTVNITELTHSLGFEIFEHNGLPELVNGAITSNKDGNQMAINNNLSIEKKRYVIAYLLSTYLLYYQNQEFFKQMHLDNNEDYDATYFARLLLIPEKTLLFLYESKILNDKISSVEIRELANIFKITPDVIEKKIEDIKNKYSKKEKKLTRKQV